VTSTSPLVERSLPLVLPMNLEAFFPLFISD
jgi:hypothetical protein